MRILRTIETFYPYVTGPTNQAFRISQALESRGIHSPILTTYCDIEPKLPSRELYQGVEVTRYRNQFRLMRYCVSLGMVRGFHQFDVIHSHNYRNFQADLGLFFSKLKKRPFVLSTHGSLLGYKRYLKGVLAQLPYVFYDLVTFKAAAFRADCIVVSSQVEYDDAREFGIDERKLRMIPAGIDLEQFGEDDREDADQLELLFVGRMVRNRKVEVLIEALSELEERVVLTIVGSEEKTSSMSRGGYLAELKALAQRRGVDARVRFVGPLYGEALRERYRSADIFVYASLYESFGQPLLEAAAAGLPIISTPVGIAKELVRNGETGYLVEFDNSSMLARCVRALHDGEVRRSCGRNMRERVKKDFAWNSVTERYIQLYRELT